MDRFSRDELEIILKVVFMYYGTNISENEINNCWSILDKISEELEDRK